MSNLTAGERRKNKRKEHKDEGALERESQLITHRKAYTHIKGGVWYFSCFFFFIFGYSLLLISLTCDWPRQSSDLPRKISMDGNE